MVNKYTEQEVIEARHMLRQLIKPGDTVYTIIRHVSASGMSRRISLVIPTYKKDHTGKMRCEIHSIDWYAARLGIGHFQRGKDGIVIGGCGMDMGFAMVYKLGQALWPKGTRKPHGNGKRNGEPDSVGGYAIKHQWL